MTYFDVTIQIQATEQYFPAVMCLLYSALCFLQVHIKTNPFIGTVDQADKLI